MVVHYPPERLRRNSEQPAAIADVLVPTGSGAYRTADVPLGMSTTSARSQRGLWALYPGTGGQVVVVHPGGALAGPPGEVAAAVDRLAGADQLEREIARGIRAFLTGGQQQGGVAVPASRRRRTGLALTYRICGPYNRHGRGDRCHRAWPGATAAAAPRRPLGASTRDAAGTIRGALRSAA
jgi:hypothetical protein